MLAGSIFQVFQAREALDWRIEEATVRISVHEEEALGCWGWFDIDNRKERRVWACRAGTQREEWGGEKETRPWVLQELCFTEQVRMCRWKKASGWEESKPGEDWEMSVYSNCYILGDNVGKENNELANGCPGWNEKWGWKWVQNSGSSFSFLHQNLCQPDWNLYTERPGMWCAANSLGHFWSIMKFENDSCRYQKSCLRRSRQ